MPSSVVSTPKNAAGITKKHDGITFQQGIGVNRLWSVWTRSVNIANVVRRYRRDRGVRDVIHCFKQAFSRPRRNLLLSATAACKASGFDDGNSGKPSHCSRGITDEDLEALLSDLDGVDDLAKKTLYCSNCSKRMIIDKKYPDVKYCPCKDSKPPDISPDGWIPYMEAENTIIWRKEYKPGKGLYAYKVYGRYKDVNAQDYADVNVDGAYRKKWDTAVAALSVVERSANGVLDQAVLHWEVLWPRLFANRDYVYVRRHKEYTVQGSKSPQLFDVPPAPPPQFREDRPSVHSNAKKKSLEIYSQEAAISEKTDKVFVIISRSCTHPDVPESRNAIRVTEYWSNMVIRTIDGPDKPGMEFVLTYYDEPAVGGLPTGVAAWATGRAAPAYLQRMRMAAKNYAAYKKLHQQEVPDFTPFRPDTKKVSYEEDTKEDITIKEEDMESSKTGPDMDNGHTRDISTQTVDTLPPCEVKVLSKGTGTKDFLKETEVKDRPKESEDSNTPKDEEVKVIHNETKAKLIPKETEFKVIPKETEVKVTPNETDSKVNPNQTEIKVKDTEAKVISKETEGRVIPKEAEVNVYPNDIEVKVSLKETKVNSTEDTKENDKPVKAKDSEKVPSKSEENTNKGDSEKNSEEEEEDNSNGSWWRNLYPFYYFV